MSMEDIKDLKKSALRIIWELRTTKGNELAEAMKSYRIQRIEQTLEALKSYAELPSVPAEQRSAASAAASEIRLLFRSTIDPAP